MEPKKLRKENIYLCKKCQYPLSYSSAVKKLLQIYGDNALTKVSDKKINLKNSKCIFAVKQNDNSLEKDYNYGIDEQKNIYCKNCKHIIGFVTEIDKIIDIPLILGFLNNDEIEIKETIFQNKKEEIEVFSQAQYTVLAKLKQLRYYVKQITPILTESLEIIGKEKSNIDECDDKLDQYKLNLVFNCIEKIEKEKEDNNEGLKEENE